MASEERIVVLRDRLKVRGVPPQGADFFSTYYSVFRGFGIILESPQGKRGLFTLLNRFFTASSVLYLGCEFSSGEHIEAAVYSADVKSMEVVCQDPDRNVADWASTLTRSLANNGDKNSSMFRIEYSLSSDTIRDRDLIVHHLDTLFPPAPTTESRDALLHFIRTAQHAAKRLFLGGFYVLSLPVEYNGVDLLLSSILAAVPPLIYVGMLLFKSGESQTLLWTFRLEPMNPATQESQRVVSLTRLKRYPPILQKVVLDSMPESSEVGSNIDPEFNAILATRVTPIETLATLFRIASGSHPREVLNKLGTFQPKYSKTIEKIRTVSDLKVQIRTVYQLLYDLALGVQRLQLNDASDAS